MKLKEIYIITWKMYDDCELGIFRAYTNSDLAERDLELLQKMGNDRFFKLHTTDLSKNKLRRER